jgi:predicted DsbA family dithiol-disulfide isomerase
MSSRMKIDFVSDVSCPWCAVGLKALEAALARVGPDVTADLHFQPFELNPQMGPEGQDVVEHITQKYGPSADIGRSQEALAARGDSLGFHFDRAAQAFNAVAGSTTPSMPIASCTGPTARVSSRR